MRIRRSRLKTRQMAEGSSLCRKHMGLAKDSEQRQRIQHKLRKPRKLMESFLKGNHFRKAPALTSKPKLVKGNLCLEAMPAGKGLRRLGFRWASRDNTQSLKGNHFRNVTALMSKTEVVKRNLYLLKKLWPQVEVLLRSLSLRLASRVNQQTSKNSCDIINCSLHLPVNSFLSGGIG